jgi:hypothetical protein
MGNIMQKSYIMRVLSAYLLVLGLFMVFRTEVFLSQIPALLNTPGLIFGFGFISVILGLCLLLAKKLSWIGRLLGLFSFAKGVASIGFPVEIGAWLTQFINFQFINRYGMLLICLSLLMLAAQKLSKKSEA